MANRVNQQAWLALYASSVVVISFIHDPRILAVLLCLAALASGRKAPALLRRTLLAVLAFNLSVSLGYVLISALQAEFRASYLLLINLRVVLLVFLGFWLAASVDLLAALSGFLLLRLIATLAIGQIKTFERILQDFRLAFRSRNLTRPSLLDQTRHASAQAQTLLDKALASASEAALAMRSRGTFDD